MIWSSPASRPVRVPPTLPIKIYSQVRLGVTPEINAICTILIAFVTLGVIAASISSKRAELRRIRDEHHAIRGIT